MNLFAKINPPFTILKTAKLLVNVGSQWTKVSAFFHCYSTKTELLVSSNEIFTTTSFIICSQLTANGHKHVTVSSKDSLDARPHEGTLAHSIKCKRTNLSLFTTIYKSSRAEKVDMSTVILDGKT